MEQCGMINIIYQNIINFLKIIKNPFKHTVKTFMQMFSDKKTLLFGGSGLLGNQYIEKTHQNQLFPR